MIEYYIPVTAGLAIVAWFVLLYILLESVLQRIHALWTNPQAKPLQFSLRTLLFMTLTAGTVMLAVSSDWMIRTLDDICWIVMLILAHAPLLLLFEPRRRPAVRRLYRRREITSRPRS